jgi:hypothetical protein
MNQILHHMEVLAANNERTDPKSVDREVDQCSQAECGPEHLL